MIKNKSSLNPLTSLRRTKVFISYDTKVICQGITGKQGSFHTEKCMQYGTNFVGGVNPKQKQTIWYSENKKFNLPVYKTVFDAKRETKAEASMIFVPAPFAYDAIIEAIEAEINLIVCITEGIPISDMMRIKHILAKQTKSRLIGPNCPGIIKPDTCKIGIMPGNIHQKGIIGIVSRSGTLTYEAVLQTTRLNLGQSTVVGIGGDAFNGTNFVDVIKKFQEDEQTKGIIMIGEIGGDSEIEAGEYYRSLGDKAKPLVVFIAGMTAPKNKRMGHAGAIISDARSTAKGKYEFLKSVGAQIVYNPADMGQSIANILNN